MKWSYVIIVILLGVIGYLVYNQYGTQWMHQAAPQVATSTTPSKKSQATSTLQKDTLAPRVHVAVPARGASVGQSFIVQGEAPGTWFFEGTFPLQVRDADNGVIGHGAASTSAEWTTDKQVPFAAEIILDQPYNGQATLILLKDNPSGLPENDDSVSVPITIHNP